MPKMKIYVLEQRDAIYGWVDKDEYLTYSYKKFDGEIKYVIDENDIIKEFMSVYYKKMINENKDTIHVSLKEFKRSCKYKCNLQIFLCLFLEKLNMPQDTPVTNLL